MDHGRAPGRAVDLAVAWLLEHKVLLPGPTVLERLVVLVHDQAASRLLSSLASAPMPAARRALEGLLVVPPGARRSGFDRHVTKANGPPDGAVLRPVLYSDPPQSPAPPAAPTASGSPRPFR